MLKRKALRKIFITTVSCFILFTLYLIPNKINNNYLDPKIDTIYVSNSTNNEIYLLGENKYLVKTNIMITSSDTESKIKEIIEHLKVNSSYKTPIGLSGIIPNNTVINDVKVSDSLAIIDLSKELLDVDKNLEERLIESIVYSTTALSEIDKITINIDGNELTLLPKNNKKIPAVLTREFGINKVYDITNRNGIQKVTIYYLENVSNNNYYVPVTKYLNDDREKIDIIIDNLSSSYLYGDNLLSYLTKDVVLLDYKKDNGILEMNFNKDIFGTDKLLETSEYTLSYSLFDNYDISTIVFKVNGEVIKETGKCIVNMNCD